MGKRQFNLSPGSWLVFRTPWAKTWQSARDGFVISSASFGVKTYASPKRWWYVRLGVENDPTLEGDSPPGHGVGINPRELAELLKPEITLGLQVRRDGRP